MTFDSETFNSPETLSWDSLVPDEGHAKPFFSRRMSLRDRQNLSSQLERAIRLLDEREYDDAADQLVEATERIMTQKQSVKRTLDVAITRLTTLGSKASPPHPKALALVRLRNALTG